MTRGVLWADQFDAGDDTFDVCDFEEVIPLVQVVVCDAQTHDLEQAVRDWALCGVAVDKYEAESGCD